MNKAQELYLKTSGWEDDTQRWDTNFTRWKKWPLYIRVYDSSLDHKAYISGWDQNTDKEHEERLAAVQNLNRLSRE